MRYELSSSNRPLKSYDDFIFWDRATLQVLAIESMPTADGGVYAKNLAQKHGTTVSYAIVQEYFIEPDKCPECRNVLPESGPCWHNLFEAEAPADSIPFQGEPMYPNIITEADEYF